MAVIKSGATTDQWTIDATSKAGRVSLYDTSGAPITTLPVSFAGVITVANAGTFAVQAAQSGNWTARIVGNAGATLDAAGQNAASPTNSVLIAGQFNTTPTTITTGNVSPLQLDANGNLLVNFGYKATYSATGRAIAPIASATAPTFSIQGSATKTIRITRVRFSISATTGQALPTSLSLQRFSALTGGTSAAITSSRNDISDPVATAACLSWSVAATTATAVGGVHMAERINTTTAAATTTQPNMKVEFVFASQPGTKGFVLRGTADFLGIVLTAIGTTPVADVFVEWTEE